MTALRNRLLWKMTLSQFIVIVLIVSFAVILIWNMLETNIRSSRRLNLESVIHRSLIYDPAGQVDLDNVLLNAELETFCTKPLDFWGNEQQLFSGIEALKGCDPSDRYVLVPTSGYYPNVYYGLHNILIYDAQGLFVNGLFREEPSDLSDIEPILDWALESLDPIESNIVSSSVNLGVTNDRRSTFDNAETGISTFVVPIYDATKEDELGAVIFQFSTRSLDIQFVQLVPQLLLLILFCGGLGMIGSFLIARRIKTRVSKLQHAAAAWGGGDFTVKVVDQSKDEIGQLGRDLNQMSDQLEELVETRSMLVGVETRQQLARDLHDAAKQQLFAANLQLEAVAAMLDSKPEQARTHLENASSLTEQAQDELASVIRTLRPIQLQDKGLFEAAREWVARFESEQGLKVAFKSSGSRALAPEVETAFFRILQEALSNVAKHSQASRVTVFLDGSDKELSLTVEDDGIGFDPNVSTHGFGLQSMQERIERLDGQFRLDSRPTAGTTLEIKLKL